MWNVYLERKTPVKQKNIKILLLTKHFPPDIGGTEIYVKNFLSFLKTKKNILVDVLTFQPAQKQKKLSKISTEENIRVFRLSLANPNRLDPFINYNLKKLPTLSSLRILIIHLQLLFFNFFHFFYFLSGGFYRLLREEIDLIYTVGGPFAGAAGSILSRFFRKRLVLHLHVNSAWSRSMIVKNVMLFFLKRADYILANSLDIKKEIIRLGINENKIIIIRNWVDQKIFSPIEQKACRKELGLPQDKFIFLFATSLTKIKGVDLVLDVVKSLSNNRNFLFLFIGDGPFKKEVELWQKRNPNIIYYGSIRNDRLPLYINAADIAWAVCDIYYFSINTIESLVCGVPVIASNITASTRTKVHKKTLPPEVGFLINPDSKEIAKKLINLKNNRILLKQMSSRCIKFARDNYGYKNAEKIYKIFREIGNG